MQYAVPANAGLTLVAASPWIPADDRLLIDIAMTSTTLTGIKIDAAANTAGSFVTILDGATLDFGDSGAVLAAGVDFGSWPGATPIGAASGTTVRLSVLAINHKAFKLWLSGGTATVTVNCRRTS